MNMTVPIVLRKRHNKYCDGELIYTGDYVVAIGSKYYFHSCSNCRLSQAIIDETFPKDLNEYEPHEYEERWIDDL